MKKGQFRMKKIVTACLLGVSAIATQPVMSASHPLTNVIYDAASGTTYIDQVVAIDWDINNPPSLVIEGVNTTLDQAYLLSVMQTASDTLYTMTEGKMRLGKISIYSNQFLDNADLLIVNKDGRANASTSGLNVSGARNQVFTIYSNTPETINSLGRTIGHEFGHYFFGLLDEYREAGKMDTSDPGAPQDRDTALSTVMSDHMANDAFSTSTDYVGTVQTAQYRWFGKSAWETLVADPQSDSTLQKNGGSPRTWFDSFKNMTAPTGQTLTKPKNTNASRASIQMSYMSGTKTAILIDLGVTQEELDGFKKAAEASINALMTGSQLVVLTIDGVNFTEVAALQTVGAGDADVVRTAARAAINALTASTAATADGLDKALGNAAIQVSPLAAAQDAATKNGTAAPLTTSVTITQTPVIQLFTTSATSASQATISLLKNGGVMLNPQMLQKATNGNMSEVARASRGRMVQTKKLTDLVKKSVQATRDSSGEQIQVITDAATDALAAGTALDMPFTVATFDGKVTVSAYIGANTGMSLELTTPANGTITSANAAGSGITYTVNTDEGSLSFEIPANYVGRSGDWNATVKTTVASTEPVEMDVTVESSLTVDTAIIGGTVEDPRSPIITTTLSQPMPVKHATVTADIFDTNGVQIKAGLVLKDDGVAPDMKPGDGVYTASLSGIVSKAAELEVVINVTNPNGLAAYGTTGARRAGVNVADVNMGGAFARQEALNFSFTPAAVKAIATAGSGGCTLGRGGLIDPILPALVLGAGLFAIRRNRTASIANKTPEIL